jgi:hypothetical protein
MRLASESDITAAKGLGQRLPHLAHDLDVLPRVPALISVTAGA